MSNAFMINNGLTPAGMAAVNGNVGMTPHGIDRMHGISEWRGPSSQQADLYDRRVEDRCRMAFDLSEKSRENSYSVFSQPVCELPMLPKYEPPKYEVPKYELPVLAKYEPPKYEVPKYELPVLAKYEPPKLPTFGSPSYNPLTVESIWNK